MGTKRRRESKRREEGASKSRRPRMKKDAVGRAVTGVIESERRNLQRASAVLAALAAAFEREAEEIDAGDVAQVARQLIDGAINALDRVELERAADSEPKQPP